MPDNLSPADRRKAMQAVKSRKTSLERRLWAMLSGSGLGGWSKNPTDVYGNPDVVFYSERIALFVDGCFWHGCSKCNKPMPVVNEEYWKNKIIRNIKRAEKVNSALEQNGWHVIRIWEHDLKKKESRKKILTIISSNINNIKQQRGICDDG
jgi:DNA mismatch endonuclease (patch repair protein)